jgi:anti-sigma factor RsiW
MPLPARRGGAPLPVPTLGGGLRPFGSDLVPWDGGTALVVLYRSGSDRVVSLFVAEADSFAVATPQAATVHGLPTVFWQIGPVAYALNGDLAEADLMALAQAATPRPWPVDLH